MLDCLTVKLDRQMLGLVTFELLGLLKQRRIHNCKRWLHQPLYFFAWGTNLLWVSDHERGLGLGRRLILFLLFVHLLNLIINKNAAKSPPHNSAQTHVSPFPLGSDAAVCSHEVQVRRRRLRAQ